MLRNISYIISRLQVPLTSGLWDSWLLFFVVVSRAEP